MVPAGSFAFVYGSHIGLGCGFFELIDDRLTGRDFAGTRYEGTVTEDGDGWRLRLDVTFPPGAFPISGGSEQEIEYTRKWEVHLPPDFENGKPLPVQTPGDVTIMISRALPSWADWYGKAARTGFKLELVG